MTLNELKATLDSFSPVKIASVARVMESLANPPSAGIRADGWLAPPPQAVTMPRGCLFFQPPRVKSGKWTGWFRLAMERSLRGDTALKAAAS